MAGINHINELTHALGKATGTGKKERTGEFTNALSRALDTKTDKTGSAEMETQKASGLGEISSTGLRVQEHSAIVSGKTDRLLGMLSAYVSQLEDPSVSLKSIAPILEQINENADNLLKETATLSTGNRELKDIATRTVVAARTEYIRFQRGDYLS